MTTRVSGAARVDLYARAVIAAAVSYGDDPIVAMTSEQYRGRQALVPAAVAISEVLAIDLTVTANVFGLKPNSLRASRAKGSHEFVKAKAAAEEALRWSLAAHAKTTCNLCGRAQALGERGWCGGCNADLEFMAAGAGVTVDAILQDGDLREGACRTCMDPHLLGADGRCAVCRHLVVDGAPEVAPPADAPEVEAPQLVVALAPSPPLPTPPRKAAVSLDALRNFKAKGGKSAVVHDAPAPRLAGEPQFRPAPALSPPVQPKVHVPQLVDTPVSTRLLTALVNGPLTTMSLASIVNAKESVVISTLQHMESAGQVVSMPAPENAARRFIWAVKDLTATVESPPNAVAVAR